jgi:hypothetical protein
MKPDRPCSSAISANRKSPIFPQARSGSLVLEIELAALIRRFICGLCSLYAGDKLANLTGELTRDCGQPNQSSNLDTGGRPKCQKFHHKIHLPSPRDE